MPTSSDSDSAICTGRRLEACAGAAKRSDVVVFPFRGGGGAGVRCGAGRGTHGLAVLNVEALDLGQVARVGVVAGDELGDDGDHLGRVDDKVAPGAKERLVPPGAREAKPVPVALISAMRPPPLTGSDMAARFNTAARPTGTATQ